MDRAAERIVKTSAMQEALRPLHRLIADARQDYGTKMKDHAFRLAEVEARMKGLKKDGRTTDALRAGSAPAGSRGGLGRAAP